MNHVTHSKIFPKAITADTTLEMLVDQYFTAYNSARLREACHLLCEQVLQPGVTVGLSLAGALTPAGLGTSIIAPLMSAGLIDYVISTGANLYHDLHYGLGHSLHCGHPHLDDQQLRAEGGIRIYDIVFDYSVLLETDAFVRNALRAKPFQRRMGTAEFHYQLGYAIAQVEAQRGAAQACLLSTAHQCGVPIYTSSPGDSSIGMNVAALALANSGQSKLVLDPAIDVNETAAIAYGARFAAAPGTNQTAGTGKSAVLILGGGSPKNFLLQTQPHLHEVLGLPERGHDYFIQITDARPDTGGLSGATPSEAVSWGKLDPGKLPSSVVCYTDSTIALPILAAYALKRCPPRPLKQLYHQRSDLLAKLQADAHPL
ncbi:MAG: deoxyhypusine synthase [Cyanobacteria bacterium P01_A01_bin.135]